ncbi:Epsin-3, clathrin recruitment and traffic between the Golgi and endosome [Exophiala dermatitidis]|nr:Epsin-3, clathrin recruitment and traffic between the Golgi and endosome [Exophiala dermatitidis]KAJ4536568.1 Epsin-3, clathrin recruitment and traffic between the Golgi and endosome [Exophiala dermatitidis]KAJ4559422.1 Epsin-3, clathrin recruitment and traffic between the Golgi and endosome [Exophiala dermatitidis]KAJ4566105.1 Epsin-3, clathrin recruitment and traffic between the Golgi and endosome [Exophiala dermatitidis]KAJ4588289.1 Epsin-3, clathrin recruitment and traffic between the Go
MDFESLKSQVSNLTLYDIKAGVREATNGDPWGASATLMQEIAQGTHNYQQLNEIMPMIYKRFTDKTAEEWRQIYKALQLLEYLCKHGSERVIDDARSHLSLIRMLKQFYYIDPNGKDQGVNVRNRSSELVKLLSDVDTIRQERKKARANRNKYSGVEGGLGMGGGLSSGSRYGGFGSETGGFGGYQGEVYGDGGGFGGRETDFSGTQRRADQFEEYDEAEEAEPARPARSSTSRTTAPKRASPKPKEPEQDLFDFSSEPTTTTSNGKAPATSSSGLGEFGALQGSTANDDDEFDDFQSATPAAPAVTSPLASIVPPPTTSTTTSATQFAAPKPVAPGQAAGFDNIFATASPALSATSSVMSPAPSTFSPPPTQTAAAPLQPTGGFKSTGPNYFTPVPVSINSQSGPAPNATPSGIGATSSTSAASLGKPTPKATSGAGGDVFGSLWSTASSKAGVKTTSSGSQKGPDLASMAKAKSQAGIWGAASAASSTPAASATPASSNAASVHGKPSASLGNGLDDLLG